jgi:uncharacterized membrane protein
MKIKERILRGMVLFLLPLMLLFIILEKAIGIIKKLIHPIKEHLPEAGFFGIGMVSILSFVIFFIVSYLLGILVERRKKRSFILMLEEKILLLIPGYAMLKSRASEAFGVPDENWKSIIVGDKEEWKFGIEIERIENGYSVVFIPEPPDGKAGELKVVHTSKIKQIDVPVSKITNFIRKYGEGSSELIKNLKI